MTKTMLLVAAVLLASSAQAADLTWNPAPVDAPIGVVPVPVERPTGFIDPWYARSPHDMRMQNLRDSGYNPANDRDQYGNTAVH